MRLDASGFAGGGAAASAASVCAVVFSLVHAATDTAISYTVTNLETGTTVYKAIVIFNFTAHYDWRVGAHCYRSKVGDCGGRCRNCWARILAACFRIAGGVCSIRARAPALGSGASVAVVPAVDAAARCTIHIVVPFRGGNARG